jgi:hypothetical protein
MKFVICYQRPAREAGTLASQFDTFTLADANKQLKIIRLMATRICRYWIDIVYNLDAC